MVEGINGAGMTYQGSSSPVQVKTETQPKAENIANEIAANEIAQDTTNISTKEASEDNANQEENQQSKQQLDKQNAKIKRAVEDINKRAMNSEAIFGIHDATNRVTIKIVDRSTKEVIKELPPEKTLDMIAKVWELAGLMVDERR